VQPGAAQGERGAAADRVVDEVLQRVESAGINRSLRRQAP